jgi:hypothetical protein
VRSQAFAAGPLGCAVNLSTYLTLYDIGHQDGIDYVVMEYVEYEALANRLGKRPLSPD